MDLGDKIKRLRINNNISRNRLGELLYVSDKTIYSWESNRTRPDLDTIIKLCKIFRISISSFIYDNNNIDKIYELKIKLNDKEYLRLLDVMNNNAIKISEEIQNDCYYESIDNPFTNKDVIDEWVRISDRDNKYTLNYKKWCNNIYCMEKEVIIDNIENMDMILRSLNVKMISNVYKKRIKYKYLDEYEVLLDDVKDLGYYVEIKNYHQDMDKVIELAITLDLDLNNRDIKGYPYYFIER